jgi:hypothetical protein
VQRGFQGARILDYRERPEYAKSTAEYAERTQQLMNSMGMPTRVHADGGEVLFAYTQDGVEMRGMAGVSAVFFASERPNPMGGTPFRSASGSTMGTFGASAPEGQLDFDLIEAARRSIVPNGQWLDKLFAVQQQQGKIAVEGTRERAAPPDPAAPPPRRERPAPRRRTRANIARPRSALLPATAG